MQIFETTITVKQDDLDELNHVNNVRYVQWVQDIAGQHWNSKITPKISDNYFWVMLSHHIHYKGEAFLDEDIRLKTFVIKSEGVTSTRIVEIYNKNTDKLLVTSETKWCLISKATNKPTRISEELANLFN
jgi:acyl-CoA thioester hydrolase